MATEQTPPKGARGSQQQARSRNISSGILSKLKGATLSSSFGSGGLASKGKDANYGSVSKTLPVPERSYSLFGERDKNQVSVFTFIFPCARWSYFVSRIINQFSLDFSSSDPTGRRIQIHTLLNSIGHCPCPDIGRDPTTRTNPVQHAADRLLLAGCPGTHRRRDQDVEPGKRSNTHVQLHETIVTTINSRLLSICVLFRCSAFIP